MSACTQAASAKTILVSLELEIAPGVEASLVLNGTQSGAVLLGGTFDSATKVTISLIDISSLDVNMVRLSWLEITCT
jgi:hypothetical protein